MFQDSVIDCFKWIPNEWIAVHILLVNVYGIRWYQPIFLLSAPEVDNKRAHSCNWDNRSCLPNFLFSTSNQCVWLGFPIWNVSDDILINCATRKSKNNKETHTFFLISWAQLRFSCQLLFGFDLSPLCKIKDRLKVASEVDLHNAEFVDIGILLPLMRCNRKSWLKSESSYLRVWPDHYE